MTDFDLYQKSQILATISSCGRVIKRMSSRKRIIRIFNLLKIDIRTFISFVKIFGAERSQSTDKEIGAISPPIEILHIFESPWEEVLKNKHP